MEKYLLIELLFREQLEILVILVSKSAQSGKVILSEATVLFYTVLLTLDRVSYYNLHSESNRGFSLYQILPTKL